MAERAPPPADPPGPQFMAEKLARLDADLHLLLDAAAPMREDCAARDPRAPAERLRHAHRLRPTSGPPPGGRHAAATARALLAEGGLPRLYRGIGYALLRAGPVAAVIMPSFELVLPRLERLTARFF